MDMQTIAMNFLNQNPQVQQIMEECKNKGLTPQQLFYQKAEELGVNPDEIIKTLQGLK